MTTQLNNSSNELNEVTVNTLKVVVSAKRSVQIKKAFTAAELWNIQRRRKTRNFYSTRIAC
ncbi:MAG: hypothetical protein ABIY51_09195 [Ferruginibacter sp.]